IIVNHMKAGALAVFCLGLAASAVLESGCASICARAGSVEPDVPHIYPGVYPGPQLIVHEMQTPRGAAHNILVWPCGIIDFPLSAGLDTLLLPFDVPYWACTRDSNERLERYDNAPK
ncbi:MAG TPA: YceK/YidQ family lipoprotein, partial [Verrucomicrobiae bacterium]|nr:YceK/YidQ family lipoprotein [Verrucomicrobiae bacterium]